MSRKEFKFSGRKVEGDDDRDDNDTHLEMPIEPKYFTKLPSGMEPSIWLRLKTVLAYKMPPKPTLTEYPMSFDDRYWDLQTTAVNTKTGKKNMFHLIYNYKSKNDEDGIAASMLFNQIAVKGSKSGRGYEILNVKFATYDVEISENVSIRITPQHNF